MPDIDAATDTVQINRATDAADVEIATDTSSSHAHLAWNFKYDAIQQIDAGTLSAIVFLLDGQSRRSLFDRNFSVSQIVRVRRRAINAHYGSRSISSLHGNRAADIRNINMCAGGELIRLMFLLVGQSFGPLISCRPAI